MSVPKQLTVLRKGAKAWNEWRRKHPKAEVELDGAELRDVDLTNVNLAKASLRRANFMGAKLDGADLRGAFAMFADFRNASLKKAKLARSNLRVALFHNAQMQGADLQAADLVQAILFSANLDRADLREAELQHSNINRAKLRGAKLTGARVFGVSAWDVRLKGAVQNNLVITGRREPTITVDNIEIAQFVHLLLNNQNIRSVIDTIGNKGVLILGRFGERKQVLDVIREELRRLGYLPIVFDFERPTDRDFTETVMTLAGMSRFIIADITRPKSVPLELQATVPNFMIPFVPIIEAGEQPFAMFQDLWQKHRDWVLDPLSYDSLPELLRVFDKAIIRPANQRYDALRVRKAERLRLRHVDDYK